MNTSQQDNVTVMFADIVGSTGIYEAEGNKKAQMIISQALDVASNIVQKYKGDIIKMAGDDILCAFQTANDALTAACVIHDTLAGNSLFKEMPLSFHIGIHSGSGIFIKGDVYGDAVNVASRLTSVAKSGQIITSKETVDQLTNGLAPKARAFDTVPVKGREKPVQMFDIVWNSSGEETSLVEVANGLFGGKLLILEFQQQIINILPDAQVFILGREADSGLVIADSMVSRQHASIEYYRNKFVLHDMSTNGTYIRLNGENFFIKREETTLVGDGVISLGKVVDEQPHLNIQFRCV